MSLDTLIMLAGAFVVLLPFLGFPNSWDTILLSLAGILVIALGIVVRRRLGRMPKHRENAVTFAHDIPRNEHELAE